MFKLFKKKKIIITHDGGYHADDVFACAALSILLKGNIKIIRTRDPKIIEKGDYVVDVGGIYDPAKKRFDHHQKGGAGARDNMIPYAAFGLVWKTYGEKICGSKEIADKLDIRLIASIDADDNGVVISNPIFEDVYPYAISDALSSFILPDIKDEDFYPVFMNMVALAEKIISNHIEKIKYWKSREKDILDIYNRAEDKRLIVLDEGMPWQSVLKDFPEPLFAVSPNRNGNWAVLAFRDDAKSFKNRKDLPQAWAGLRDADLIKVTGVPDAIFCHNNLFIAVAKSKDGAIKLAQIALNS